MIILSFIVPELDSNVLYESGSNIGAPCMVISVVISVDAFTVSTNVNRSMFSVRSIANDSNCGDVKSGICLSAI